MHSGFGALRAALPMNLKGHFPGFKIWARAQADIDRITAIWESCLDTYGGPYLFGSHRTAAEAMYAPVVTRFMTYDVPLSPACTAYCETVMALPEVQEWVDASKLEPEEVDLLDMEF